MAQKVQLISATNAQLTNAAAVTLTPPASMTRVVSIEPFTKAPMPDVASDAKQWFLVLWSDT